MSNIIENRINTLVRAGAVNVNDVVLEAHEVFSKGSRYDRLIAVVQLHRYLYHKHDVTLIPEMTLDSLKFEIVGIEEETGVIREDSPSQTVGSSS